MYLEDGLYGGFEVTEPVLLEILASPEMERLKNISASGYYPGCSYNKCPNLDRWQHSLGVFLLLRRFGASLEEQIAGLIHDVSHSAFSHTIDYIKKNSESGKTQSAQDDMHEYFVRNSSIKTIIEAHGFDLEYIFDDANFPLKENNLPDICADRIDYTLRQAYLCYDRIRSEEMLLILNGIMIHNGSFIFKNLLAAQAYAKIFMDLNDNVWSDLASAVMYQISAQMFRRAIELRYVAFEDFYKYGDQHIINIIQSRLGQDKTLAELYQTLQLEVKNFESNPEDCIETCYIKNRVVDPLFENANRQLMRLSETDEKYCKIIGALPKFKQYSVALKKQAARSR